MEGLTGIDRKFFSICTIFFTPEQITTQFQSGKVKIALLISVVIFFLAVIQIRTLVMLQMVAIAFVSPFNFQFILKC